MATQEPKAGADPGQQIAEVNQLPLPIGWEFEIKAEENGDPRALPNDELGWIIKLLGILFTTFAVSLGAPFWFDLLNKFVNIRGSGAPPPKNTSTTSSG